MSSVIVISIMNARMKKMKSKKGAIEKLPDDFEYEVNAFRATSKSKFKICFSNTDLKIDNMKGWLIEFQSTNNVAIKIKAKGRQTKGYLLQTYYRCQHNTTVVFRYPWFPVLLLL